VPYLIPILLFIIAVCPVPLADGWFFRQALGLELLAIILSTGLWKKFHWIVALTFIVFATYGIFQWGYPYVAFHNLGPIGRAGFGSIVGGFLLTLFLFAAISITMTTEAMSFSITVFAFAAIVDAFIMIYRVLYYGTYFQGCWVMTNASLDASFLALMLPYLFGGTTTEHPKSKVFIISLILIAICFTKSNTGVFAVGIALSAWAISTFRFRAAPLILVSLLFILGVGTFYMGNKFGENSGRLQMWNTMMGYWMPNINHWVGAGPGAVESYGPAIQILAHGSKGDIMIFPWMHNDWLQVLFEQGILGLCLVWALFVYMLKYSFKRPVLFSMVVTYGFIALTQYPTHLFIFQVIGMTLIAMCFDRTSEFNGP
jgi:O-antigen ligase